MPAFSELPTKDQIDAIDDVSALEGIRDEVDRAIAQIETDLEYSGRDDDWYDRAKHALAYHKYVDTMLGRRLRFLRKPAAGSRPTPYNRKSTRQRRTWSAYTQAAFDGEIIDPEAIPEDLAALESALAVVTAQINALKDDKDDELLNFTQEKQDFDFLARVSAAARRCGAAHQVLLRRAAAIRKQQKSSEQAQRDATRPQHFVDAAREVLDRDTFLAIWEVVDRRCPSRAPEAA